eukprot:GCRY01001406.1.p1 GENE.GCRY01001406.1~~GCRY01001406.1.p1  ORF type:complete len:305 (+),score=33.14 GCRY01001406.1:169-1083(+)
MNELFMVKCFHFLGCHQACIKEASSLVSLNPDINLAKDIFVYKSYFAMGKIDFVSKEIESRSELPFKALLILCQAYSSLQKGVVFEAEKLLETSKEILLQTSGDDELSRLIVSQLILLSGMCLSGKVDVSQCYSEALTVIHPINSIESNALELRILLAMNCIDKAEEVLSKMVTLDEDNPIVQFSKAYLLIHQSRKTHEAFLICEELVSRFGSSSLLLNSMAVASMKEENWEEANQCFQKALEMQIHEDVVLLNSVICAFHSLSNNASILRQMSQFRDLHSPLVSDLLEKEASFDNFAKSNSVN